MLKKILFTLALSPFMVSNALAQSCNADFIKADYRIVNEASGAAKQVSDMTLWRKDNQVAHQFKQRQITEIWFLQKNQKFNLTRQFEQFKRGIEYQAMEMRHKKNSDWQSKYALISKEFMQSLNKSQTRNGKYGCDRVEHYDGVINGSEVSLQWLPKLQLVKELTISQNDSSKSWYLLDSKNDYKAVKDQYSRWSQYQTTDYADIGDNESDPFLLQMINLGHK